jgi:fatty aldehyde-generating acyl-ACP reductase
MDPKTFAFILHSGSVEELKKSYPLFRMVPDFILKRSFRGIAPFKVSQLKDIRSLKGKDISGFFIDCPILIEEGQQPEERLVFGKILSAASLARKMGAEIIGTGGCASLFKDGGEAVAKHLNMPFTNGNALTAWSVFEAAYRSAKAGGIALKEATVAVMDATEPVASLCAVKLAEYARKIILTGGDNEKLEGLKKSILESNSPEVIIENMRLRAFKDADIIVAVGLSAAEIPDVDNLEPSKIICFVSLDAIAAGKLKSLGATCVEAGLIKLPYPLQHQLSIGLPGDVISAALAETMLLTLEQRFINYSCGKNINPDKLEEIADIAAKHGFEVWAPEAPIL